MGSRRLQKEKYLFEWKCKHNEQMKPSKIVTLYGGSNEHNIQLFENL